TAAINSRPLTYNEDDVNSTSIIRPEDFVYQRIQTTLPLSSLQDQTEEYRPSREAQGALTKNETIEALQSSIEATESVWKVWREKYLAELREAHRIQIDKKRGHPAIPKKGQVVIICDPDHPRGYWRLGKIVEIIESGDGAIREVHLLTKPAKSKPHVIKRPPNLIVPLELDCVENSQEHGVPVQENSGRGRENEVEIEESSSTSEPPRYNLRRRKLVNYQDPNEDLEVGIQGRLPSIHVNFIAMMLSIFLCFLSGVGAAETQNEIECTNSGLRLTGQYEAFEACVKNFCTNRPKLQWNPRGPTEVWIPLALKTRPHRATVKIFDGLKLHVLEKICPAVSTCEAIECTICLQNIFNPECSPMWAWIGLAGILYCIGMALYCCFQVPITLGGPVRILWRIWKLTMLGFIILARMCFKKNEVEPKPAKERSLIYTKEVEIKVWSTKRCPHMGSCKEEKCAKINGSSMIPELEHTHGYVGTTGCVESCGGPGCDCFFPSLACLFYRIYAVPQSTDLYEIFKCIQWERSLVIQVKTTSLNSKRNEVVAQKVELFLNQPTRVGNSKMAASTISTSPSPLLNTWFIRNENETAIWPTMELPSYQCYSEKKALVNECQLRTNCQCNPAESEMRCECAERNLTTHFNTIEWRLPVQNGHWTFEDEGKSVLAHSTEEVSTEIVIRNEGSTNIEIWKEQDKCDVEASHIQGCYACAEGGHTKVACRAEKITTVGTIKCEDHIMTVVCSPIGHVQELTFFSERAQFYKKCEVSCGNESREFHITGILKYTGSIWTSAYRLIEGNSSIYNEINLPDLTHLYDGFMTFIKTETMSSPRSRAVGDEILATGMKKMTEIANKARVIEQAKNLPRRGRDAMIQRKDMRNEGETKKDILLNVLKIQWDIDTISEKYRDLEKQYKNEIEKLRVLGRLEIYSMDYIEYQLSQSEVNWQMNLRNFQEERDERASDRTRAKREIEELRREVQEEEDQEKEEKLTNNQRLELFGKILLDRIIKIEQAIVAGACSKSTPNEDEIDNMDELNPEGKLEHSDEMKEMIEREIKRKRERSLSSSESERKRRSSSSSYKQAQDVEEIEEVEDDKEAEDDEEDEEDQEDEDEQEDEEEMEDEEDQEVQEAQNERHRDRHQENHPDRGRHHRSRSREQARRHRSRSIEERRRSRERHQNRPIIVRQLFPPDTNRHNFNTLCVFCRCRHHSNECGTYPDVAVRKAMIDAQTRCRVCLNKHPYRRCHKEGHTCSFCLKRGERNTSHHAALCEWPINRM
ncbi:hypothetical protein CRE_20123, partial [Caenorhabditis remanei]